LHQDKHLARRLALQRAELEFSMQKTAFRPIDKNLSETIDRDLKGNNAARLLADAQALARGIATRASEVEQQRRVPWDIIDSLRTCGLFKMLVPRSHGGLGLTIPDVVPAVMALSAADGSVGWIAMIAASSQMFCSRLPRTLYDELFENGADPMVIGVGTPAGQAEKIAGGYRVTGRWPFASGCEDAQWILGHCVIFDGGKPALVDGAPITRFIALPANEWRIEETWHAAGLAGTGSHHIALDQVEVPESRSCDLLNDPSCVAGAFEAAVMPFLPIMHAALAVGIASGALADLAAIANAGRRQMMAPSDQRDSPVFQHEVGRAGAALEAAKSMLEMKSASLWDRALKGSLDDKADFVEALQAGAWIQTTCTGFVDRCYELAGSAALTSPLERRMRDIHLAGQHMFASERYYAMAGARYLGFPPVNPLSGQ
jgi:alkylation response protein AidB-like acyl-CoA dehydrogenase